MAPQFLPQFVAEVPLTLLLAGSPVILALGWVVYILYIHPLSKVPGPKLYAISVIPYLYYVSKGTWVQKTAALHDEYGPVVRICPFDVSFITAKSWQVIAGHKNDPTKSYLKDPVFFGKSDTGAPSVISSENDAHRRQRRLMAHAFSEKALRSQEDMLNHYSDLLITKLSEKCAKGENEVDIMSWYNFTTFDLIGDLAFGQKFGCLESGGYHPWVAMIFDNFYIFPRRLALLRISWTFEKTLMRMFPPKSAGRVREHKALVAATARARVQNGKTDDRNDIMSYILRHNDEKGMTEDEIIENSEVIILGGSETTATLLSGVTYLLLTNRETLAKVVAEIRSAYKSVDEMNVVNISQNKYLIAVLTEALRVYPPVPVGLPRKVAAGGDFIEGYWMPENTHVMVSQYAAYHNSRNFRDPHKFIPERWLGDERFANDQRDVMQPFSVGPRNCIAMNLAYVEMRLILGRMLWHFDLEILPESKDWMKPQRTFVVWEKPPLKIKLTPVVRE